MISISLSFPEKNIPVKAYTCYFSIPHIPPTSHPASDVIPPNPKRPQISRTQTQPKGAAPRHILQRGKKGFSSPAYSSPSGTSAINEWGI